MALLRIYDKASELQQVTLEVGPDTGLVLYLDGMPQFVERTEYRYHECLALLPSLFCDPRAVFIGGGGDGLAAATLLRTGRVERVVLCDYDPAVTELAARLDELVTLNRGALSDPRVTVVNRDAVAHLESTDDVFDLIVLDFPDPYFAELGPLYGLEFYRTVAARLAPGGVMITQTLSLPSVSRLVIATARAAFAHVRHCRPEYGAAFTLATATPWVRRHTVPDWARFLSDPLVETLFVHPRDVARAIDPGGLAPVTGDGRLLVETAVRQAVLAQAGTPNPHRARSLEVYLTPDTIESFTAEQIEMALVAAARDRFLVVVISERFARRHEERLARIPLRPTGKRYERYRLRVTARHLADHRRLWDRLGGGRQRFAVESYVGRPTDVSGLAEHLEAYFAEYGSRFHDAEPDRSMIDQRAWYVMVRHDAEMVAIARLLEREERTVEVELFYGLGSARENFLALLLLVGFLGEREAEWLECYAPVGVFGQGLRRLGARLVDRLAVYLGPEPAPGHAVREEGADVE